MRTVPGLLAAALTGNLIVSAALADPALALLDEMRQTCTAAGLALQGPQTVWAPLDLGPAGPDARIFVSTDWGCPEPPGVFWHTGGGEVILRAEGQYFRATARGWGVLEFNQTPVIMLSRHGTFCDGAGYQPCLEAVTWSDGRWLSVRPQTEAED